MKYLLSTILFFFCTQAFAQIGGISGSKLNAVTVDVVDHHKIEFEPGFYHFQSTSYWDNNENPKNTSSFSDSVQKITGIYLRFTYGLWDRMEIGTTISTDVEVSSWGMRYVLIQNEKFSAGVLAGLNVDFGNGTFNQKTRPANLLNSIGGGFVGTYQFNSDISLDVDLEYMHHSTRFEGNPRGDFFLDANLGYYVFNKQLQLIGGFGYQNTTFDTFDNRVLTLYPGITVETGKSYIIVISAPFDVYGENAFNNHGFNFALTLTFE